MKSIYPILAAALLAALPAQALAQAAGPIAESTQPHSKVSLMVEPALSDGRLVVKLAAKNSSAAPIPFGPSMISLAKVNGEAIALYPLQSLVNDVRGAAGMEIEEAPANRPTEGAYAAPQMATRDGRVDVSGYTGGVAVGSDEYVHRNQTRKFKPTISKAEAETQIAALRQAILQDSTVAPGQIAVGQIVTDKLQFAKGAERIVHIRVRMGDDVHTFTVAAPKS
jgi:hypothetical protein